MTSPAKPPTRMALPTLNDSLVLVARSDIREVASHPREIDASRVSLENGTVIDCDLNPTQVADLARKHSTRIVKSSRWLL